MEKTDEMAESAKRERQSLAEVWTEAGASMEFADSILDAGGYEALLKDEAELLAFQDGLDNAIQGRFYAVRNNLRAIGWTGKHRAPVLGKLFARHGAEASVHASFRQVGGGANCVAIVWHVGNMSLDDMMDKRAMHMALQIELLGEAQAKRAASEPAPVPWSVNVRAIVAGDELDELEAASPWEVYDAEHTDAFCVLRMDTRVSVLATNAQDAVQFAINAAPGIVFKRPGEPVIQLWVDESIDVIREQSIPRQ